MAKLTLILLTLCLVAANMDMTSGVCPNCTEPIIETCDFLSDFKSCLSTIESNSSCTSDEKLIAEKYTKLVKAKMCLYDCSGVSELMSSLGLVLTFSGVAYLLNSKH